MKRLKPTIRVRIITGNYTGHILASLILIALALMVIRTLAHAETTVYCTGNEVRVRYKAATGEVLYWLDRGDEVTLYEIKGAWGRVVRSGDEGWVSLQFLSERAPVSDPVMYKVVGGNLIVRSEPQKRGKNKVSELKSGATVEASAWLDGWVWVGSGWVNGSYLEEVEVKP